MRKLVSLISLSLLLLLNGCSDFTDLIDLALDPPSRKPIDQSRVGVNNFFVDPVFGTIPEQYRELRDVLGIQRIRILMAWTTDVQPTPSSEPNYGFFDAIIEAIPPGVEVVVVLAHTPSWITNSANWINGNPRTTWVERWVRPTVARYANTPGIIAYEVWNEPDLTVVPSDIVLELENPDNYARMLASSVNLIRDLAPGVLILNAATQSIQQNFPTVLNYNKRLAELGVHEIVDIYNIHYYSSSYESIITSNGVGDFLNSLGKPIWITESGETGPNNQLAYVETAWPFLRSEIPSIDWIFYFNFGSTAPIDLNFGLRTTDPEFPVSDLYINLRDG